jgi:hypothetical protein
VQRKWWEEEQGEGLQMEILSSMAKTFARRALAFDFGEEQSRDFVSGHTREEDFGLDNRREARLTR